MTKIDPISLFLETTLTENSKLNTCSFVRQRKPFSTYIVVAYEIEADIVFRCRKFYVVVRTANCP